jgi:hypothetical protein
MGMKSNGKHPMKAMKGTTLLTLCFTCALALTVHSAPVKAEWFKLNPGEECVTNFVLKAGQSRDVEFSGPKYRFVGFKTDATFEVCQKYFSQRPQPVLLRVKGVNSYVGSVAGAGGVFSSVNGKFRFTTENGTDVPLRIVVFQRKPDGVYE